MIVATDSAAPLPCSLRALRATPDYDPTKPTLDATAQYQQHQQQQQGYQYNANAQAPRV